MQKLANAVFNVQTCYCMNDEAGVTDWESAHLRGTYSSSIAMIVTFFHDVHIVHTR